MLKEKPKRNQSIVGVRSVLLCAASSSSGLLLAPLSAPLGTIPGRSWRHLGQVLDLSWTILGLSWAILGLSLAILGLSWAILALSWTCLGLFWACLGPSWAYFGRSWPCLGPVWSHLGALLGHLGAILSPLGQDPENDPQKYEKTVPGLNDFGDHFGVILGSFSGPFLGSLFEPFLDHFWGHFGGHFGARSAQEGGKMSPRGPARASNTKKAAFSKTSKNLQFFKVFGVQRPRKRASGDSRRLQRGT